MFTVGELSVYSLPVFSALLCSITLPISHTWLWLGSLSFFFFHLPPFPRLPSIYTKPPSACASVLTFSYFWSPFRNHLLLLIWICLFNGVWSASPRFRFDSTQFCRSRGIFCFLLFFFYIGLNCFNSHVRVWRFISCLPLRIHYEFSWMSSAFSITP